MHFFPFSFIPRLSTTILTSSGDKLTRDKNKIQTDRLIKVPLGHNAKDTVARADLTKDVEIAIFETRNNSRTRACVKLFRTSSQSAGVYIRGHEREPRTAFVLLRPEHYRKRYLRFLRVAALYATATATYAVTPINIDQAQQWPAGKRIDILYFPPALTGCLRGRRCVTQTAIPGQTAGYAVLARDSTHDEMLMDENDMAVRFMNGCDRKRV